MAHDLIISFCWQASRTSFPNTASLLQVGSLPSLVPLFPETWTVPLSFQRLCLMSWGQLQTLSEMTPIHGPFAFLLVLPTGIIAAPKCIGTCTINGQVHAIGPDAPNQRTAKASHFRDDRANAFRCFEKPAFTSSNTSPGRSQQKVRPEEATCQN